ncbi:MAG: hypothetical protein HGB29_10215 [Chlorobiaceae bacterium]|nr:hypothetical protein [Chlorobiaceae bacterium]NTW75223.1 hypothetical protein [Chlorobiaceae bacterium]
MSAEQTITLYLTGWQKRMIQDHIKLDKPISKLKLGKIPKKEWVMYRVPVFDAIKKGAWLLYLSDEQISHVTETLGVRTKISALNITAESIESKVIGFE